MNDPFVKVIAHSISPDGIPLVTVHMHYWRAIHAEVMTHRAFSRNARSSRAVPIAKMIEEVERWPFVPRHWGKNQKGMQATEECNERIKIQKPSAVDTYDFGCIIEHWTDELSREAAWLEARDKAVEFAKAFMDAGYHKQIVNRLLEPFMMIDTLVTATDWANFFALRDHADAEPHIRDLAVMAKEAIAASEPQKLSHYQWHLPYVTAGELAEWAGDGPGDSDIAEAYELGCKISAARCARISYAPFDGNGSIKAELDRFEKLVGNWPVHASPVEHQAQPDSGAWCYDAGHGPTTRRAVWQWNNFHQQRNFRGWRQYRAMIPNETVFG